MAQGPRNLALAVAVLTFLLIGLVGPGAASAADDVLPVPETGGQGMLRLTSSVYPLDIPQLGAGETFSWQVGVVLDGPASASATIQVQASGSLSAGPGAYRITARSCPAQWIGTSGKNATLTCLVGIRRILAAESFVHAGTLSYPLGSFTPADQPWVLFTLERPDTPGNAAGTLKFGIGVVAGGDETGPTDLADTGAALLPHLVLGAALILGGLLTLLSRRRRGRS